MEQNISQTSFFNEFVIRIINFIINFIQTKITNDNYFLISFYFGAGKGLDILFRKAYY